MKPTKRLNTLWIILITLLAVSCSSKDDTSGNPADPDPNQSNDTAENAPDFSLTDLSGATVKLDDFNSKVLVMFFFGNGCPTCKTAGSQIQSQLADAYKTNSDFAIIGLDVWNGNSNAVSNFKNTTGIDFPLLLNASATATSYKTSYDRLIVVDKIGKIRFKGKQLASSDLANAIDAVKTYLEK
jgi:peroxiredoxin